MARNSIIPDLIDALFAAAQGVLNESNGWLVADGVGTSDSALSTLYIGVMSPFTNGTSPAADSTIEWRTDRGRDETGWVNCYAIAWDGDGSQKAARDKCMVAVAAMQDLVRARPLAISVPGVQQFLLLDYEGGQLGQDQDDSGALAVWSFHITFKARI